MNACNVIECFPRPSHATALPGNQTLAAGYPELLRRGLRARPVLVLRGCLRRQRCRLTVDDEYAAGLDHRREFFFGGRHHLRHSIHHFAILGGHGLVLVLHFLGAELVGLLHLAGMEQARLLDGDFAARIIEDCRTFDLGRGERGSCDAAQDDAARGACESNCQVTLCHLILPFLEQHRLRDIREGRQGPLANVPAYTNANASGFTYLRSAALTSATVSAAIAASIFADVSNVRPRYACCTSAPRRGAYCARRRARGRRSSVPLSRGRAAIGASCRHHRGSQPRHSSPDSRRSCR